MTNVQFSIRSVDGRYNFVIKEEATVGRDPGCTAVIPETALSRTHARFFQKDKELFVEDLGSTNGTFVNDEKLGTEPRAIRYNDVVRFDVIEFKVFVELAAATEAKPDRHVVAAASSKNETRAPRSWAVNEEVGHGTVVMDIGAKSRQADTAAAEALPVDSALLQGIDQPTLIGIRGVDQGKTITLPVKGDNMAVWQLGRGAEMDIVINDPSVSEHQAQIIFEQGTWKLVDVISTNATYVNGEKILTHYLSNGDKFSLGATEYMFRTSNKTDFRPARNKRGNNAAARAGQSRSYRSYKGLIVGAGAVIALLVTAYVLLV